VAAVRDYANEHYEEGGWDYVVECWDDKDIVERIQHCTTTQQAITEIGEIVGIQNERRRDAESEIF